MAKKQAVGGKEIVMTKLSQDAEAKIKGIVLRKELGMQRPVVFWVLNEYLNCYIRPPTTLVILYPCGVRRNIVEI